MVDRGANLLAQYVGVAAVLGNLAQHVEYDPSKRELTSPVPSHDVVERQPVNGISGALTSGSVGGPNRLDRVVLVEAERLPDLPRYRAPIAAVR